MSISHGWTANAASAHKHDSVDLHEPAMTRELYHFLHPLQFLQERFSALTTPYATPPSRSIIAAIDSAEQSDRYSIESTVDAVKDGPMPAPLSNVQDVHQVKAKSTPKPRTSYHFAHPPPRNNNHHRLQGLPRMLLQLRRMGTDRRASPTLEVFPATTLSRSLRKRLPRLASYQNGLGKDDLLILNCDPYHGHQLPEGRSTADEITEAEDLDHRLVVATIRRGDFDHTGKELNTEILVGSTRWTASRLDKGGYEFTSTNVLGDETIARWLPKKRKALRRQSYQGPLQQPLFDRFRFSLINLSTRNHPFVGSLDRSAIVILDQHVTSSTSPSSSSLNNTTDGLRPGLVRFNPMDSHISGAYQPLKSVVDTTEETKVLMLVTAIWVAIAEGWSQVIRPPGEGGGSLPGSTSNPSARTLFRSKSARPSSPASTHASSRSSAGSSNSWPFRPSMSLVATGRSFQRADSLKSATNTLSSDGMQESPEDETSLDSSSHTMRPPLPKSAPLPDGQLASPLRRSLDFTTANNQRRMTFNGLELFDGTTVGDKPKAESRRRSVAGLLQSEPPRTEGNSGLQKSKKKHKLLSFMTKKSTPR